MPNVTARVRDADLKALLRKLSPGEMLGPVNDLVRGSTKLAEQTAKDRAPYATGAAYNAIHSSTSLIPQPRGVVTETEVSGIMTNYGGWGKKSRYASTSRTNKTGKTRGWFMSVPRLKAVKTGVQDLIEKAKRQIKSRWDR